MIKLAKAENFELERIKRNRRMAIEAFGKSELLQELGTEEIVKNLSEEDKKRLRKLLE